MTWVFSFPSPIAFTPLYAPPLLCRPLCRTVSVSLGFVREKIFIYSMCLVFVVWIQFLMMRICFTWFVKVFYILHLSGFIVYISISLWVPDLMFQACLVLQVIRTLAVSCRQREVVTCSTCSCMPYLMSNLFSLFFGPHITTLINKLHIPQKEI